MRILAHKGMWSVADEANTLEAIRKAFEAGCDVETDIRMQNGRVVIKHDPPLPNEALLELTDVLALVQGDHTRMLALHVKDEDWKESAAVDTITTLLTPVADHVFLFDMSRTCCQEVKKRNRRIQTGVSVGDKKYHDRFCDAEEAVTSGIIDIIWADEYRQLYSKEFIERCHAHGKLVYCISPDLASVVGHPRAREGYQETWEDLLEWGADGICTDQPLALKNFITVCK